MDWLFRNMDPEGLGITYRATLARQDSVQGRTTSKEVDSRCPFLFDRIQGAETTCDKRYKDQPSLKEAWATAVRHPLFVPTMLRAK